MPIKQLSAPEVSTGSQTAIVPEDDIVEHTSDTGNPNNGEDDEDQTPPLGRGTTAGGEDNDRYDGSSSSRCSSSRLSLHSHRSLCKTKKIKKNEKRIDHDKSPEQQ